MNLSRAAILNSKLLKSAIWYNSFHIYKLKIQFKILTFFAIYDKFKFVKINAALIYKKFQWEIIMENNANIQPPVYVDDLIEENDDFLGLDGDNDTSLE